MWSAATCRRFPSFFGVRRFVAAFLVFANREAMTSFSLPPVERLHRKNTASDQFFDAAQSSKNPRIPAAAPNIAHPLPTGEMSAQYLTPIPATTYINAKTTEYRRTIEDLCNKSHKRSYPIAVGIKVRDAVRRLPVRLPDGHDAAQSAAVPPRPRVGL
jgi:hypothetical protein